MEKKYYTREFEIILKNESEKCESLSLLHNLTSKKYNKISILINIPVIILSSFIGFFIVSNIAQYDYINYVLGGASIFNAILKSIDNYFSFSKKSENHRIVALNYDKISKIIQIQLSLERECRINPDILLNQIQVDLDNIKSSEGEIPDDIIMFFNQKYEKYETSKPNICNGLTVVKINDKSLNKSKSSEYVNEPIK